MRIFENFPEAINELRRELKEMGIVTKTQTMQDKLIADNPDYETFELQNYIYTVTNPNIMDLPGVSQPWVLHEWLDRLAGINGQPRNPGESHRHRKEVWSEFIHDGKLAYTYSERFAQCDQVRRVIQRLKQDKYSRQLYIAMWDAEDSRHLGSVRVPCSLGWHLMFRQGQLHITYFMRSCDFYTHFQNDIYLSVQLRNFIAAQCDLEPGRFTHFMGSFHVYRKDVESAF